MAIKLTYICPNECEAGKFANKVILNGWNMRYRAKDKRIDVLYGGHNKEEPIDLIQQMTELYDINITLEKTLKVNWKYQL